MNVNDEKSTRMPTDLALTKLAGRLAATHKTGMSGFIKMFKLRVGFARGHFEFLAVSFQKADGFDARLLFCPVAQEIEQSTNKLQKI